MACQKPSSHQAPPQPLGRLLAALALEGLPGPRRQGALLLGRDPPTLGVVQLQPTDDHAPPRLEVEDRQRAGPVAGGLGAGRDARLQVALAHQVLRHLPRGPLQARGPERLAAPQPGLPAGLVRAQQPPALDPHAGQERGGLQA